MINNLIYNMKEKKNIKVQRSRLIELDHQKIICRATNGRFKCAKV
jgi:hypothetical protein